MLASAAADGTVASNVWLLVGNAVNAPIKVERIGAGPAGEALTAQGVGYPLRINVVWGFPAVALGEVGHAVGLNSGLVHVPVVTEAFRALDQYNVERASAAHNRA